LASKDPVLCFDQSHQHSLGGGSYWADGYNKLLNTLRHNIGSDYPLVSGNFDSILLNINPSFQIVICTFVILILILILIVRIALIFVISVMLTNCFSVESNGEVYIENVLGFLSLGGYELCVMVTIENNLQAPRRNTRPHHGNLF
jgi:hypothetical protein